jgi:hypothetical protein
MAKAYCRPKRWSGTDSVRVDTGLGQDVTNRYCLLSLDAIKHTDLESSDSRKDRENAVGIGRVILRWRILAEPSYDP